MQPPNSDHSSTRGVAVDAKSRVICNQRRGPTASNSFAQKCPVHRPIIARIEVTTDRSHLRVGANQTDRIWFDLGGDWNADLAAGANRPDSAGQPSSSARQLDGTKIRSTGKFAERSANSMVTSVPRATRLPTLLTANSYRIWLPLSA